MTTNSFDDHQEQIKAEVVYEEAKKLRSLPILTISSKSVAVDIKECCNEVL